MDKLMILEKDAVVKEILGKLNENGFEAYVVGGAVRDAILDRKSNDIDIATDATVDDVNACFERVVPIGAKFGTVLVITENGCADVTTFKGHSIEDDLGHRDFTINAMAYHPESGLIDPYGGVYDLTKRGVVRSVNPRERMEEDYVRSLRAVRFAAEYDLVIDRRTYTEARIYSKNLDEVSGGRIGKEIMKLAESGRFSQALYAYSEIITNAIPSLKPMLGYEQHNHHHNFDLWHHTLFVMEGVERNILHYGPKDYAVAFVFAALFHDSGKPRVQSEKNGEWHYYNHETVSAEIASYAMAELGIRNHIVRATCAIIMMHSYPLLPQLKYILHFMNRLDYFIEGSVPTLFMDCVLFKLFDDACKKDIVGYFKNINNYRELSKIAAVDYAKVIDIYVDERMFSDIPYSLATMPIDGNDLMEATGRRNGRWVETSLELTLRHIMNGSIGYSKEEVLEEAVKMSKNFKEDQ